MNKYIDSLPLPSAGGQLPPFDQLSPDELNAEAMQLSAAVEQKLGVKRTAAGKRGNHAALDRDIGALFGVSKTTWSRLRQGNLWQKERRNDNRLKYRTMRHEMHAFVTGDTPKPEAPTDHKIVTLQPLVDNNENVGLNFRVPPDFAREFKQAAITAGMKQNAFLENLLGIYQADDFKQLLHQWLERIKEIDDRFDVHEAGLAHERSVSTRVQENTKRDLDALKKSHKEALAAVNDRLDSLAKHNKQLQTAWWRRWI